MFLCGWGGSPAATGSGKTCLFLMSLPLRSATTLGCSLSLSFPTFQMGIAKVDRGSFQEPSESACESVL